MILKYFLLLALVCGVCKARFPYDYYDDDDDNEDETSWNIDVLMPNVRPTEDDQYICASQPVVDDLNIVNFIPKASMKVVHHMLLFGCKSVHRTYLGGYDRGCSYGECTEGRSILFAWARDAPPPAIPPDVGFHIGGDSGINYLTLQIHYGTAAPFAHGATDSSGLSLTVTTEMQRYLGGIFLNVGMNINVSPDSANSHTDVACEYESQVPIYAFGFRTHAHGLGKVISGYRVRNNQWTEIAKGNPQWPQAFYPMDDIYAIQNGDIVATRCTFDGTRTDHIVHVGSKHTDEMCNLYIMYYTDSRLGESYKICASAPPRGLFANIPSGSDIPPEGMPTLDGGKDEDEDEKYSRPNVDEPPDQHNHHGNDDISDLENKLKTNVQDKIDQINDEQQENRNDETTTKPESPDKEEKEDDTPGERVLNEVPDWGRGLSIGQVGGLAMDREDNVQVFHRAERTWEADSFDSSFHFLKVNKGPIKNNTILSLDKETGAVINGWGSDQFYLPHGISVDHKGNVWVTDVALHQVFKYPPGGAKNPSLTLGVRLMPGSDSTHFCQPADVVVDSITGNFYVADGYCNSRIMKYSPEGTLLLIIDNTAIGHLTPSTMTIVHSLTLANNSKHICATDREHGRVLCFDTETGKFLRQIKPEEFGSRVYAAVYSPHRGGILFAINGPTFPQKPILGVTVSYNTGKALETWSPEQGFAMPHDVAVSSDANNVYVGEIGPNRVWKFVDPVPPKVTNVKSILPDNELARDSLLSHGDISKSPPKDVGATMVIVVVLAVPIILMMVIAVVVRLHAQGKLRSGRGMFVVGKGRKYANDSFSIGNFFNRKKGFTQVSTDDSDQEGTTWSEESDVEEYSILNSKPTQNL